MLEFCQNQSLVPDISVYNCCRYSIVPEQKARTTYDNILRLVDDPDVCDAIKFLRAREIVHYQRFSEALGIAQDKLNSKNFYGYNPAFDICDHELITALVTERGICFPPYSESIPALFCGENFEAVKPVG